jgi:IS1 family transposase
LKRLARKTVCHSKSDEMHCLFVKMYINHRNVA